MKLPLKQIMMLIFLMKSAIFGIIAVVLQSCDSIIYRDTIATASATNTRLFVKKVKKEKNSRPFLLQQCFAVYIHLLLTVAY